MYVCVSVYSRVGASYAGRPICVCAVSAPLRRVITIENTPKRNYNDGADSIGGRLVEVRHVDYTWTGSLYLDFAQSAHRRLLPLATLSLAAGGPGC